MANLPQAPELTLPVVIHYLQAESARHERERNYWELERAEMKARIAKLEGERKSNDRMKDWYDRRVKMLEIALHEERRKTDPSASLSTEVNNETSSRTNDSRRSRFEHDDAFMDVVHSAQAALKEHDGRTKSRTYLERCLTEITYLVNANPTITANHVVENHIIEAKAQDVFQNHAHTQSVRRPISPTNLPLRRPSPAPIIQRVATDQVDAIDEVAMEDLEQIEKIQHTFDANGHFVGQRDEGWDFSDKKSDTPFTVVSTLTGHLDSVNAVGTLLLDGDTWLATAGADATIKLHVSTTPSALATLRDHDGAVNSIIFIPDGGQPLQHLYSGGNDMVIRKWSVNLRNLEKYGEVIKPAGKFISHTGEIIALSQIRNHLLSASKDGSIRMWDTESFAVIHSWHVTTDTYPTCLCIPTPHRIAAGYSDGCIRIFQLDSDIPKHILPNDSPCLSILATSHDTILSGHEDGTIKFWSLQGTQYSLKATIEAHSDAVTALAASPLNSTQFASVSKDCSTRIWDSTTCIQDFTAHRDRDSRGITGVSWTIGYLGDENLVTTGGDGAIQLSQRS